MEMSRQSKNVKTKNDQENIFRDNCKLTYREINKLADECRFKNHSDWYDIVKQFYIDNKIDDMVGFEIVENELDSLIAETIEKIERKI